MHTELYTDVPAEPGAALPEGSSGESSATGDLEPPAEVRSYYFAGTQHSSGGLPLASRNPLDGMRGVHNFNITDYTLLNRAALLNLVRWATAGEEPPPSAFPRLIDGTAASISLVLEAIGAIPGVTLPDPALLPTSLSVDLGPQAEIGVGRFPAATSGAYPAYVSAVDADGNEVAGIRLPAISVPVATYTGWNPRHPDTGGERQIVMMMGSTLPFPATIRERERSGDPRLSIEERYRDRDEYLARARAAGRALAAQGYLLPDDIELAAHQALKRYEAFAPAPEPARALLTPVPLP